MPNTIEHIFFTKWWILNLHPLIYKTNMWKRARITQAPICLFAEREWRVKGKWGKIFRKRTTRVTFIGQSWRFSFSYTHNKYLPEKIMVNGWNGRVIFKGGGESGRAPYIFMNARFSEICFIFVDLVSVCIFIFVILEP